MTGEKIQDVRGHIVATRVRGGGRHVEHSDRAHGTLCGVATTDLGAYVHTVLDTGELIGEGQGVARSEAGDVLLWHGRGVGRSTDGGLQWRYSLTVQTRSPRWQHLDGAHLVREWTVDADGNTSAVSYAEND